MDKMLGPNGVRYRDSTVLKNDYMLIQQLYVIGMLVSYPNWKTSIMGMRQQVKNNVGRLHEEMLSLLLHIRTPL